MKARVAARSDLDLNLTQEAPCGTPGESEEPHLMQERIIMTSSTETHTLTTTTH